jgi:hypothetical protein
MIIQRPIRAQSLCTTFEGCSSIPDQLSNISGLSVPHPCEEVMASSSFTRSLPLLSLLLLYLCQSIEALPGRRRTWEIVAPKSNEASKRSTFAISAVDPLAAVAPLWGHTTSIQNQIMPAVASGSASNAGAVAPLKSNFEVNRPTRVLPEQEDLTSCTITIGTHSFANRCVAERWEQGVKQTANLSYFPLR